jgi:hypothetical protein
LKCWKFVCKNDTEAECFQKMLFGDIGRRREIVGRVKEGSICSLYNLDADTLFCPFEARSSGQMNTKPEAWGGRFPAQVKVGCRAKSVFSNASKEFDFLQKVTLELTGEQGKKIFDRVEAIRPNIPTNLKEEIQRLDEEIHLLAHRIEEVRSSTKMHSADRRVEIDRLKGELYFKMKDFVWWCRCHPSESFIQLIFTSAQA